MSPHRHDHAQLTDPPPLQNAKSLTFIPFLCALPSLQKLATTTALSAALLLTPPSLAQLSHATLPPIIAPAYATQPQLDTEHALADEVWQLVNRYYVDPNFAGVNWPLQRTVLSKTPLKNRVQTYKAVRRLLFKLSDRYTRVLTPSDMQALRRFDVSGVGLLLTTDVSGDLVVATDPPPGSAAAHAGIVRGDILQFVEGIDVTSVPAFAVSELMQGDDGTEMSVQFQGQQPKLLRRSFPPAEGKAALRTAVLDSPDGKLGYIRLKEFRASSREEVSTALGDVLRRGAEWVVLDLRGNGGGVFEGALEIAGLFEGEGVPVARVQGRKNASADMPGPEEVYDSRVIGGSGPIVPRDVELALLLDRGSASSSEVLAGALRDKCRAALVGERSFGKGLIQGVFGLSDGGGVVITVAEYQTPDGMRIQNAGLEPDVAGEVDGFAKLAKIIGIEKVDESNVGVTRGQVREVVRQCAARHEG